MKINESAAKKRGRSYLGRDVVVGVNKYHIYEDKKGRDGNVNIN